MKAILKGQLWHFTILVLMLAGLMYFYRSDTAMDKGSLFGISTNTWLIVSVCVPIAHQIYVAALWRLELFRRSLTKAFGKKGFTYFKIGFAVLILLRPVSVIILAFSNANTLELHHAIRYLGSGLLLVPGLYLIYSIKRYFGFEKAFGKDHFYPKEARTWSLVKRGIFKYTSNAMYVFGFMLLWIPGLFLQSKAALVTALFSHIYIWVHYYFTEKPDMDTIYK